jgi:hypothetical protein
VGEGVGEGVGGLEGDAVGELEGSAVGLGEGAGVGVLEGDAVGLCTHPMLFVTVSAVLAFRFVAQTSCQRVHVARTLEWAWVSARESAMASDCADMQCLRRSVASLARSVSPQR